MMLIIWNFCDRGELMGSFGYCLLAKLIFVQSRVANFWFIWECLVDVGYPSRDLRDLIFLLIFWCCFKR
jgi:hypothetical protein